MNMKELRFGAARGAWRVAFAFDTNAILLIAGNKVRYEPEAVLSRAHSKGRCPLRGSSCPAETKGKVNHACKRE